MLPVIGYEYLLSRIPLRMPPLGRPAQVRPVTRVERMADLLAVPRHVAPAAGASVLQHVLFALEHEDTRLAILHEAQKLVPAEELVRALTAQRLGAYLRRAAFIWEKANGQALPLPWDSAGGNYVDFFEPGSDYTGPQWKRSRKYRVNFNGIGPCEFCPVVGRNAALEQRGQAVLERLRTWVNDPQNQGVLDRVMNWAYLSETRDSYAIENETPAPDKERAFLRTPEQLRDRRPLSEECLVDLQNLVITSAIKQEQAFRRKQNWLQRGGHGALAVRYLPPPPAEVNALMDGLMRTANAREGSVPPLVEAALVSFGFVFVHPFTDGNGRLSRLLAHHSLSLQGALPTVNGNPSELLGWLAPDGSRSVVGNASVSTDADVTIDHVGSLENAATVIARLHRGEKRLVFCDSRSSAEQLSSMLRTHAIRTFVSHASLSVSERRQAEAAFSEERDCVIVATSTLELGIDVGDLDRVVQIDSPSSVSSFLQRMGRTGRRPGGRCNCLFLTTSDNAFLLALGVTRKWSQAWVEAAVPPAQPWHIVAQQALVLSLERGELAPSSPGTSRPRTYRTQPHSSLPHLIGQA